MAAEVRRVVTGHDMRGKAVVAIDGPAPNVKLRKASGGLVSTLVWVTDETPADMSGHVDRADRNLVICDQGQVGREQEFTEMLTSVVRDDP